MDLRHDSVTEREILEAFMLLFGPHCGVSIQTIKSIKPLEIKIAYRRKALRTHPDRARFIGKDERELAALFTRVSEAYEKLIELSKNDWRALKNMTPAKSAGGAYPGKEKNARTTNQTGRRQGHDRSAHGGIPDDELLFGQYLYYSGAITWDDLIQAIIWQRSQRPLFGQIAQSWKILTGDDINAILKRKARNEKIGDYALRNGYINRMQQLAIAGRQKSMQLPIGKYFIDRGTLTTAQLHQYAERQRRHNRNARNMKKAI